MGLGKEIYKDIKSIIGWIIGILVVLIVFFPGILLFLILLGILIFALIRIRKKFNCTFGEALFLWFLNLLRFGLFIGYFVWGYFIIFFIKEIPDIHAEYGVVGVVGIPLAIFSALPIIINLRYFVLELLRDVTNEDYNGFEDEKKMFGHFISFCSFQFFLFTFILIGTESIAALGNNGVLNIFYGVSIVIGGVGLIFYNAWLEDYVDIEFTKFGEIIIKMFFLFGILLILLGIVLFIRGIVLVI